NGRTVEPTGWVIETVVSPFHCLYQDALHFHTQSRLAEPRSESEASRLARAAFVLYLAGAEALVHQAAHELGRPELMALLADPCALRPRPLDTARSVLDAAIGALDRRLGGALTRDQRHHREPVRVVHPQATRQE